MVAKELRHSLTSHAPWVHRQNAELETLNADIQTEKEQLLQQNTHLTERLEAVAKSPTPGQGINADTPLDLMLNMLQRMIMVTFLFFHATLHRMCALLGWSMPATMLWLVLPQVPFSTHVQSDNSTLLFFNPKKKPKKPQKAVGGSTHVQSADLPQQV